MPTTAGSLINSDMASIELSVVMPCYNEEENLEDSVAEIVQYVLPCASTSELLIVDDGSCDRSPKIATALSESDQRIRLLRQENLGHGAALFNGTAQAKGKYIFWLDSDRQVGLANFPHLFAQAKLHDAAIGVRTVRQDPLIRLLLSWLIRIALLFMFGVYLRDANCPCKLFEQKIWQQCRILLTNNTLAPSLFLAVFMAAMKLDVVEIEVTHHPRTAGKGSFNLKGLIKFSWRAFLQLFEFKAKLAAAHQSALSEPN